MTSMKLLLVRPKAKRQLSNYAIKVEPLELELLGAYLEEAQIPYTIKDYMVPGPSLKTILQKEGITHVLLTSYITTVDEIHVLSKKMKKINPYLKVLVGGPHAVLNAENFAIDSIDAVIHSGGITTISQLLHTSYEAWKSLKGIAYWQEGQWQHNVKAAPDCNRELIPQRGHMEKYKKEWHYMGRKPVALVKTAFGCPYHCEFCYCKLMEDGYYAREVEKVLDELEMLSTENVWIVDDTFLISVQRIEAFIEGIKKRGIKKRFIIYSRADFIVAHREIMPLLREIGVEEVIVGLEAVSEALLQAFNKEIGVESNRRCIEILHEADIRCTGLFIFPLEATFKTVRQNLQFVKNTRLYNATFSIFTPLKGTPLYESYKDKLMTTKSYRYNFLHLVVRPTQIGKYRYMCYFYLLTIGAFYYMLKERIRLRYRKMKSN